MQAAVEGRLTAEWRQHHPPGETGEQLLARILKERRAKWEEYQLKKYAEQGKTPPKNWKEKYPEPVKPDTTGLPDLPEGWVWGTVGQVAQVGTGATPLKSNKNYYNGGDIPWVTSGALNKPFVFEEAASYITELAIKETNACVYPKGTLLVAMYGEGKTRGKVSELGFPAAVNQACAVIVFGEESEKVKPFIKTFFQKSYEDIRLLSSGGVQPNLNLGHIMETKIPLPPIQEQNEVIKKLEILFSVADTADDTIDNALKRAARLRQSILKRAFEGRVWCPRTQATNPPACCWSASGRSELNRPPR